MKLQLIFLCAVLSTFTVVSQNVKLSISNTKATDNSEVWFCRSIDGDPINYVIKYDKEIFKQGNILKSFSIDSTMFIMIADNPFVPKIRMVVCKDDSVHILVNQDTISHKVSVHFTGSNAKGHEIYYNSPLFVGGKTLGIVYPFLGKLRNLDEAIEKTEQLKGKLFSPIDSLFNANQISKEYYQFVKLEADAEFLNAILSATSSLLTDQDEKKCILNKNELIKLQIYYCEKYDPFSAKYRNVNYRNENSRRKCILIADRILTKNGNATNLKLWDTNDSYYNFAPKEIQEGMFATDLIFKQKFGMISDAEAMKNYNKFKGIFPKSVFLPVIESSLTLQNNDILPYSLLTYNSATNGLKVIANDSLTTFKKFLNKYFVGKFVVVDMWATYCSPCKIEFAYAKDIHDFLTKHGIELLYFSVDNQNNATGWINDIKKYSLNGYNYFATDNITSYLKEFFSPNYLSIPRYFLFGRNGDLIDNNLPKPSDTDNFKSTILKKLNN